MSWISYSLLMFFSSVALYLVVRKSSIHKVPTQLTNLSMFAIPLIAFLLMGIVTEQTYSTSSFNWIVVLVAGAVFAFGGNTASLKAIDIAPNPGYSLVLSKSYVLFTTIVSVLLLGGQLTLQKAVAIFMIVGFSALVMINKKTAKKVKDATWIKLSFSAFFAWGMLSLSSKYLFTHGLGTIPFLIYLYTIVTFCILLTSKGLVDQVRKMDITSGLLLLAVGLFSIGFNLGQFEAIKLAPNVGYVNAINAASISLVTVLAVVLFKDELTKPKAIGVLGVTVGLILLLV